jgi:superfamily II DNA or RNA helicase
MPLDSQRALHNKYGQKHLIPGIQRHDLRGRFIICMTQTLAIHPRLIDVDMLIVDECHVFSAPTFCQAIFNISFRWSLGLSANTTRADHLEWIFQNMLGLTTVVMEGRREPARAFFYPVDTEYLRWDEPYPNFKNEDFKVLWCKWYKKVTTSFDCMNCPTAKKLGTFDPDALSRAADCVSFWRHDEYDENSLEHHIGSSPKYTAWIMDTVDTLLKDKRNIMLFTRLREPLETYHKMMNLDFGSVSGLYLGAITNQADRNRNDVALKRSVTLCTYKKAGKGLDVAAKDAIVFASPVSGGQLNQVVGRVERVLKGKRQPVAIHAVIPFVTSVARMRGCIKWYLSHNYEVNVHPVLARHAGVPGH